MNRQDQALLIEKENRKLFRKLDKKLNLKKILKNNRNHLDFGCGWGFFTKIFAENFPNINVDGLDIDSERIEDASENRKLSNMNYICSEKIQNKYDSITALFVLHEIKDVKNALKNLHTSLNKGGLILVYEFKRNSKEDFRKLFKEWDPGLDFIQEYKEHNKWSIKEFKQLIENQGFKTLKTISDNKYYFIYLGQRI